MKIIKIITIILFSSFILIQFYPINSPVVIRDNPNDFMVNNQVPQNIQTILKTSCYDCHSNETRYPWYASIAPIKWLVYKDIEKGRTELNFSIWESLSDDDKADALYDISEEVLDGEMPMKIYLITHKDAKLTETEKQFLSKWAEDRAENF